jgi:hypothetical protein
MRRQDTYVGLVRSAVVVCAIGFAWSSFVVAAEPPASSPTVQNEKGTANDADQVQKRAVRKSGGPTLGYTCGATECTCTGDIDCNNMFSSNDCRGPILDNDCDTTNPLVPVCHCIKTMTQPPKGNRLPIAPGRLPLQNAPGAPAPKKFDPRAGVAPLGTVPLRSRGVNEGAPATSAPAGQETAPASK